MFVRKVFEDDCGNPSSMRIAFILFLLIFMGNWTYANITYGQFHSLNLADMGTLAAAFLAKAYSKKEENASCPPPD